MALIYEKIKPCGVKIGTVVSGVPSYGSGVLYSTPTYCDYNYILTAKHIFQEDSQTPFDERKLFYIEVLYSDSGHLKRLDHLIKGDLKERLIVFDEDFAIVIVKKKEGITFPQILVSEEICDDDKEFFSWGVFSANESELHYFAWQRNDLEVKRFQSFGNLKFQYLSGLSGAGIFHKEKSILYGIIYRYPNKEFQNETIDCVRISFEEINERLKSLNKITLDTNSSQQKREINKEVVYIHEAIINGVCIDLELARKRLKADIQDDWFHDPLNYIDLLNQDYLFKQFEPFFGENKYTTSSAERFFVPKMHFTLRQALILPFVDRIMYMGTVGVIADKLDHSMIPNVYSARYNKCSDNQLILNGVEQWKKMKYKLGECALTKNQENDYSYGCVIEIDLLNFYDNIDKKLLHEKIKRVCITPNERKAAELLHQIICQLSHKESGLPQNSDASSLLASFYLNQVDIFMYHHTPQYFRFMDDIRIFCLDKYEARKILQTLEFELRRCHLSVNSQKTKILSFVTGIEESLNDDEINRNHYENSFDLELNKIARFRSSQNYANLNNAFHLCLEILDHNITSEDSNSSEDKARRLNYSLSTIAMLAKKKINLYNGHSNFQTSIEVAVKSLKDKPWITPQICKVLNLVPTDRIKGETLNIIKNLILDDRFNVYSFQTYQLWLLLAKHKCNSEDLKKFAVRQIEKNDDTNKAPIAAMIIYICSVDIGYRRIILRKLGENFTREYFQNRTALIALRSFSTDLINKTKWNNTLENAHEFTHKFKDRDLVFVQGFEEDDDESENPFDQLYSI